MVKGLAVNCAPLIHDIYEAFSNRKYPGDNEIVHCEYDARWGGTLHGPCRECKEAFAPYAFLFWLPSFLAAAVRDPREADIVLDSLEFRFRPPRDAAEIQWQKSRLPLLSDREIDVVIRCFRYLQDQGYMDT